MNPHGVTYSDETQFGVTCSNDEHVPGCPCQAGGDPIYRCHWCGRDTSDGDYVLVMGTAAQGNRRCCSTCWERGDEGVDMPVDYTEDELNREGLPEFNGAFKSW